MIYFMNDSWVHLNSCWSPFSCFVLFVFLEKIDKFSNGEKKRTQDALFCFYLSRKYFNSVNSVSVTVHVVSQ